MVSALLGDLPALAAELLARVGVHSVGDVHLYVEALLVALIVFLLLQKSFRKKNGRPRLTDREMAQVRGRRAVVQSAPRADSQSAAPGGWLHKRLAAPLGVCLLARCTPVRVRDVSLCSDADAACRVLPPLLTPLPLPSPRGSPLAAGGRVGARAAGVC